MLIIAFSSIAYFYIRNSKLAQSLAITQCAQRVHGNPSGRTVHAYRAWRLRAITATLLIMYKHTCTLLSQTRSTRIAYS